LGFTGTELHQLPGNAKLRRYQLLVAGIVFD
jgi:hypothetical protein